MFSLDFQESDLPWQVDSQKLSPRRAISRVFDPGNEAVAGFWKLGHVFLL